MIRRPFHRALLRPLLAFAVLCCLAAAAAAQQQVPCPCQPPPPAAEPGALDNRVERDIAGARRNFKPELFNTSRVTAGQIEAAGFSAERPPYKDFNRMPAATYLDAVEHLFKLAGQYADKGVNLSITYGQDGQLIATADADGLRQAREIDARLKDTPGLSHRVLILADGTSLADGQTHEEIMKRLKEPPASPPESTPPGGR